MRVLENPSNVVGNYITSGNYVPKFDFLNSEMVEFFIVNVEKGAVIDIWHTGFSQAYLFHEVDETPLEEIVQESLQESKYRIIPYKEERSSQSGRPNIYELYAVLYPNYITTFALQSRHLQDVKNFTDLKRFKCYESWNGLDPES